jgi:hypothetical protein
MTSTTPGLKTEDADRLDPAHVAPVVVYLASDGCELNGQVLAVAGGTIARTFSATTQGWRTPRGIPVTAESVRDHVEQILDPVGAAMPTNVQEEKRHLLDPSEAAVLRRPVLATEQSDSDRTTSGDAQPH